MNKICVGTHNPLTTEELCRIIYGRSIKEQAEEIRRKPHEHL